jgi:hypothetical protein
VIISCSMDWKNNLNVAVFHLTQRPLQPWRTG